MNPRLSLRRERESKRDTEKAHGVGWMHSVTKVERESTGSVKGSQMVKSSAVQAPSSGRGRLVKC